MIMIGMKESAGRDHHPFHRSWFNRTASELELR